MSSTSASFSHIYPGPGTYTYTLVVTDPGGFNSSASGSVTVTTTAQASLIGPFGNLDCQPDSVQLTATGPGFASYTWSTGATTPSIWAHTAGTYSVTCTDPNGCSLVDTVWVEDSITTVINGTLVRPLVQPGTYVRGRVCANGGRRVVKNFATLVCRALHERTPFIGLGLQISFPALKADPMLAC